MSNAFEFTAQSRDTHGRAHARRMRHNGLVPGVVYGAGKPAQSLSLSHNEILHTLDSEAVYSHILTLNIDGKSEQVVLKSLQRHPFKPKIEHIDFLRIEAKEKLTMNVPLHFIGEEKSPGVKEGGVVSHLMTELEIKCLPADLPEFIEVNISTLEIDKGIHLSEIVLPKGVELALGKVDEEHDQSVVNIHMPRAEKEEEPVEAAAESEGAEGKNEQDVEGGEEATKE